MGGSFEDSLRHVIPLARVSHYYTFLHVWEEKGRQEATSTPLNRLATSRQPTPFDWQRERERERERDGMTFLVTAAANGPPNVHNGNIQKLS